MKIFKDLKTFTEFMFKVVLIMGVVWVSISYVLAIYGALVLHQLEPLIDLSKEAMGSIIAVLVLKVISNIFEHNDGLIFGYSDKLKDPEGEEEEPRG